MRKIYTLILAVITCAATFAQDIHYSQYFNAPILLNPALTGFTPGVYRVGINYRNQWFSAANSSFFKSAYMTTAGNFDMPIKIKNDALGVGLFVANDQAGANTFSTFMFCASVSYIKTLGKKHNHHLSVGFQGGYTMQSIKTENFEWASQFQDNIFNNNLISGENISKGSTGYLNLNAGLLWYGKLTDKIAMYAGGSLFNISSPKYDILAGQSKNLYMRWNVHTGFDFIVAQKYHLFPALMYMRQGVDNELHAGLGFGMDLNDNSSFILGMYNRLNTQSGGVNEDGIIPYAAFEISGFKLGVSYDVTLSKLGNTGSGVGALELSLIYVAKRKEYNYKSAIICPRF